MSVTNVRSISATLGILDFTQVYLECLICRFYLNIACSFLEMGIVAKGANKLSNAYNIIKPMYYCITVLPITSQLTD